MEKNEIIIGDDPGIKTLNKEELIIYKYLSEENNPKIKSDIISEIDRLKQIEESAPKIDENKEKQLNEEIQNYFKDKNISNQENILYSIDDLHKEKIDLENNIKSKQEAKELLKQLKSFKETKNNENINSDLITKIKSNDILSKNHSLMKYLSKLKITESKKENLTEEQKILGSFRNLIKTSYIEAKNKEIMQTNIMNLFKELNLENFDISKMIKENDPNKEDEKIIDFLNVINITSTFNVFLKELHKYNPYDNNLNDNKSKLFLK